MPAKPSVVTSKGRWESDGGSIAGRSIDFIQRYLVLPETRSPMVLHDYQRDLIEQWCDPDTKVHATVIGAGNAKTTTLAAFVTSMMYLTYEASIPVVAETVQQGTLTTWGKVKRFIELTDELEQRAEILEGQGSRRGIFIRRNASHCYTLADKPAGLQGINPGPIAVLEEMSEASIDTYSALVNRLGKRPNSKVVGISTPSFLEDNALITLQRNVRSGEAMPGVVLTEFISDQKDHRDTDHWHLANPALRTDPPVLDYSALQTSLAVLPEQQFRCYRLCQNPTGSQSCWLNALDEKGEEVGDAYDVWMKCAVARTLRDQHITFVGVDMARSRDNAAVVWGQFQDDGRLHVKCRVWTPTRTGEIDQEDVAEHIRSLCIRYSVQAIWYDPAYFYNAGALAKDGLPMVEVVQTTARMAPIVGHAYEDIRRLRITHDGTDQTLTSHVMNARRHYCAQGFTLEKRTHHQKIDATIALVLCHAAANRVTTKHDYDNIRF